MPCPAEYKKKKLDEQENRRDYTQSKQPMNDVEI